jgi:hypothetical protein
LKLTDVSEVLPASIFKVMSKLCMEKQLKIYEQA